MKIKVIIHEAEEGGYWAEVPALPGCATEADTMDQLIDNIRDAAEGWLAVAAEDAEQEALRNSVDKAELVEVTL